MKVLLDVAISPRPHRSLQEQLEGAVVETVAFRERHFQPDNRLLAAAVRHDFTAPVTTDRRTADEQCHPAIAIAAVDDKILALTREGVAALHHDMWDKPYQANRTLGVLSKTMNQARPGICGQIAPTRPSPRPFCGRFQVWSCRP